MRNGIPVICYGVGCIPEQIGASTKAGFIVNPEDNFVELSLHWIQSRMRFYDLYANSSKAALDRFMNLKIAANSDFEKYFSKIISNFRIDRSKYWLGWFF